jgi:hypothetical protein
MKLFTRNRAVAGTLVLACALAGAFAAANSNGEAIKAGTAKESLDKAAMTGCPGNCEMYGDTTCSVEGEPTYGPWVLSPPNQTGPCFYWTKTVHCTGNTDPTHEKALHNGVSCSATVPPTN